MTSRLHSATGAVVLFTALLIGGAGGAVATADTGTSDSTTSRGSHTTGQAPSSRSSKESVAASRESVRTALRDVVRSATSALDSRRDRAFRPSRGDSTQFADADLDAVTAVVDGDDSAAGAPEDGVAVGTGLVEGQPVAETPTQPVEPKAVAPTPVQTGPDISYYEAPARLATGNWTGWSDSQEPTGSGSSSPYGPPGTDQGVGESGTVVTPTPITQVTTTMTTVVVSLGSAAAAIPTVIFSLPTSRTPVSDVIALLETVLTSVGESATAFALLPSGLAAFFGADLTGPHPVLIGAPSYRHIELLSVGNALVAGPQTTTLLPLLPMAPVQPSDVFGDRSGLTPSLPTALTAYTASLIVPTSLSARTGEHQSLIDRAFGALLVPLTLWALATGALPGLAGMLIIFGAGIRVGYRQAKAGFAVKVAGIARFAGPGPLGVVRSGSLVALHQRRVRAEGPRALRWSQLGEQAA